MIHDQEPDGIKGSKVIGVSGMVHKSHYIEASKRWYCLH